VGNALMIINQIALSIFRPRVGFQQMPKVRARAKAAARRGDG
jgi:hypothetical protein